MTKGGIVYNRHHKPIRLKWIGNNIYTCIYYINKKKRFVRVDKLVYQTYVQNPPYDYELEHINGDEANCNLENLKHIPLNKKE